MIPATLCKNFLSHVVITVTVCNNFVSNFVIANAPELKTCNLEPGTHNPGPRTLDLGLKTWIENFKTKSPDPKWI